MKNTILHWSPRILAILYALFISIFALDVFGEYHTVAATIFALMMHLIPTVIVGFMTAIAWKWELIGGILFIITGIGFTIFFHTYEDLITFFIISGPPLLIGILFLLNKHLKQS